MDWFHCNRCFRRSGRSFLVSSCGHICCDGCLTPKRCCVCGASCDHLAISDQMKPREQVFFQDPVKLIQSRMEHIAQIGLFQRKQKERVLAYFKHQSTGLEKKLKETTDQYYREISKLKRENAELKKPLSQWRVSPGSLQTNGNPKRVSLPVAITSPAFLTTPTGSDSSSSSVSAMQERGLRSLSSASTPRSDNMTPNFFSFLPGSARPSPRPWPNASQFTPLNSTYRLTQD
ncbi:RING finger protein 212B-like [Denticeps clupeoides]|uniref:RING finger protein 212B-like n=1 Tax=Denticeps clupeoides TaxID=299321 RepID=UPI0010A43BFA|nr:RING finger protein 212B [Denticeps clupeoides]